MRFTASRCATRFASSSCPTPTWKHRTTKWCACAKTTRSQLLRMPATTCSRNPKHPPRKWQPVHRRLSVNKPRLRPLCLQLVHLNRSMKASRKLKRLPAANKNRLLLHRRAHRPLLSVSASLAPCATSSVAAVRQPRPPRQAKRPTSVPQKKSRPRRQKVSVAKTAAATPAAILATDVTVARAIAVTVTAAAAAATSATVTRSSP